MRIFALGFVLTLPMMVEAQTPTPCFGSNHLTTIAQSVPMMAGETWAFGFSPPVNVQIAYPELFFPPGPMGIALSGGVMEIRSADPTTGLPSSAVLGSGFFSGTSFQVGTWLGPASLVPIVLSGSTNYWMTFTPDPALAPVQVGAEDLPPGPDIVPWSQRVGGVWQPIVFQNQFKLRFSALNCNPPGTGPSWTMVGAPCSGTGIATPAFSLVGNPRLGTVVSMTLTGAPPGSPVGLFWSQGAMPNAVALGGGCFLHLEPQSFLGFAAQGFNPLAVGVMDAQGTLAFLLPVPNLYALIGQQYAFQAACVVPYGVNVAGTNVVVTSVALATIGF